jgi:hypothetical protein
LRISIGRRSSPVEFDQVKDVENGFGFDRSAAPQKLGRGHAIRAAYGNLPVEDAARYLKCRHRFRDERLTLGPILPIAREKRTLALSRRAIIR